MIKAADTHRTTGRRWYRRASTIGSSCPILEIMPMRLTPTQIAAIEQTAREWFPPRSRIRLFGSRLDDARRGGDIDLLVEPPTPLAPKELVEL